MLPPYYPYEVVRREIPNIGIVLGRSMAYKLHRYINLFLGVPYAKPPVYERRFKVCIIEAVCFYKVKYLPNPNVGLLFPVTRGPKVTGYYSFYGLL